MKIDNGLKVSSSTFPIDGPPENFTNDSWDISPRGGTFED